MPPYIPSIFTHYIPLFRFLFFSWTPLHHPQMQREPAGNRSNADGITFQENLLGHCHCHGNPLGIVQALIGGPLEQLLAHRRCHGNPLGTVQALMEGSSNKGCWLVALPRITRGEAR